MIQQPPALSLVQRLRAETAEAHSRLEAAVGFDIHRPSTSVASAMLGNFYRVLTVFEPVMLGLLPQELRDRSRLALLEADLVKLRLRPTASSEGFAPHWLPKNEAEAMGSLYVMEGSTLGGKLIAKALRRTGNWPLQTPNYFDPYGAETGTMWTSFQDKLLSVSPVDAEAVIHGANQTFIVLESAFAEESVY